MDTITIYHEGMTNEEALIQGCTCAKDDVTTICPIFAAAREASSSIGSTEKLLLTDDNLIDYIQLEGFLFNCPKCNKDSVLVNGDIPGLCLNTKCRALFDVRSTRITQHVRNIENQMRNKRV